MSIFESLKQILRKIMEPAEDPSQAGEISLLNRYLHLQEEIAVALSGVEKAKHQLQVKSKELHDRADGFHEKARKALVAQREDSARIALNRRLIILKETKNLDRDIIEIEKEEERLTLLQHRLATRLEAFQSRRDAMSASQTAVEAHLAAGEVMGEIVGGSQELDRALESAEKEKAEIRARAEAIDELLQSQISEAASGLSTAASSTGLDPHEDVEIEMELEELKKEIKKKEKD
jgi:phage shock protein A